jgi:hypothetical protein
VDAEADKEDVELAKVREEGRGRDVLDDVDCGRKLSSLKKPFTFTSGERRLRLRLRPGSSRRHAVTATVLGLGR